MRAVPASFAESGHAQHLAVFFTRIEELHDRGPHTQAFRLRDLRVSNAPRAFLTDASRAWRAARATEYGDAELLGRQAGRQRGAQAVRRLSLTDVLLPVAPSATGSGWHTDCHPHKRSEGNLWRMSLRPSNRD